jgi:raffinose/stachyose/melibiose transport system permease protein
MKPKAMKSIFANVLVWTITLMIIVPLIIILINSLKTQAEAFSMTLMPPKKLQFSNYAEVFKKGRIISSFLNSMLYSTFSALLIVLSTSMAAFVISRNRTKWNRFIYYFIILGLAMPINIVALMKVMQITQLNNTRHGIIFLYTAINLPLFLFINYGFIGTIPEELDEAAVIDGCGPFNLFFRVIFPLLKPSIVTTAVLSFIAVWNDFLLPLYFLNSSRNWPMSLAVYNFFAQGQHAQSAWNLICADIVITCVPIIVIYLLAQKYIVGGMTSGAVKN